MTTYRERRQARADRLREWAEKRAAKSAAAFSGGNAADPDILVWPNRSGYY